MIKNIVLIQTDQQRADTIAALGNPHMLTPAMDRLVREGIAFPQSFCCGATCIASRAALYTGLYPHNTGCYAFDEWSHHRSWLHDIKTAGFATAAIGKVHHSPSTHMMAYGDRIYVENFPEMLDTHDDYANYLKAEGQPSGCRVLTGNGNWLENCTSSVFPLEEKYHPDAYVGRMAVRWIEDRSADQPFFLHIGFQGPHDPYDPPARVLEMYQDREVPMPHIDRDGLDVRPPHYARHIEAFRKHTYWDQYPGHSVAAVDLRDKTPEQIQDMRRHYYAKITHIDEQIGRILESLEQREPLDNTLILFTSDHGDNLGDHELVYKWLMTDQTVRVPLIARLPGAKRAGTVDNELFSQIDIGPTLLDALSLPVHQRLDGRSQWLRISEGDFSTAPERVYCEDNYLTMARTRQRKMITYAGQPFLEYFDMENDPWEENNLALNPEYQAEINAFKAETLDWLMVSRYLGSLPQANRTDGKRTIWPANHPHDPYVLQGGRSIGNNLQPDYPGCLNYSEASTACCNGTASGKN